MTFSFSYSSLSPVSLQSIQSSQTPNGNTAMVVQASKQKASCSQFFRFSSGPPLPAAVVTLRLGRGARRAGAAQHTLSSLCARSRVQDQIFGELGFGQLAIY